jgi:hypothetical protein
MEEHLEVVTCTIFMHLLQHSTTLRNHLPPFTIQVPGISSIISLYFHFESIHCSCNGFKGVVTLFRPHSATELGPSILLLLHRTARQRRDRGALCPVPPPIPLGDASQS